MENNQSNTFPLIETYYKENYSRILKRLSFRAGTQWDAEDVAQEAFTRALKYGPKTVIGDMHRWFSLIITNALRDHMNAANGYSYVEESSLEEESVDCTGFSKRVMFEIYELIGTKSERQMDILNMHIFEGYSAKDISEITDHSYARVHKTISRFREELKTLYEG